MDNILRRLRTQLGWQQKYLAQLAGIKPLAVLKYEQGLYNYPSPAITHVLSEATGISQQKIMDVYRHDIKDHRKDIGPVVEAEFNHSYLQTQPPVGHIKEFRQNLAGESLMAFCKLLAVHPSVVARYEKAPGTKMPAQLREAFYDCGLEEWQVDFIDIRHTQSYSDTGRRTA